MLDGEEPSTVQPGDCPLEMKQLVRQCIALEPEKRPKMNDVVQKLEPGKVRLIDDDDLSWPSDCCVKEALYGRWIADENRL